MTVYLPIPLRIIRRWPYALGVLFLLYAWAIPEPHAFNNAAVDRATWAIGGLLLIWSGIRPHRGPRLTAMLGAVGLFAVRVTVLAAYPSTLTTGRILAGAVLWSMLALLVVAATLTLEIIDTPARLAEQ